jgi:hypothetical protein
MLIKRRTFVIYLFVTDYIMTVDWSGQWAEWSINSLTLYFYQITQDMYKSVHIKQFLTLFLKVFLTKFNL